ncbi:cytochrome c3 family protein [Amaricoccus tamworthensis]|uniref:cytochrome c3 family protein n=1 Tax=Amaricoccus tamworthensis TaxID=57002 RepID=UPI003C7B4270
MSHGCLPGLLATLLLAAITPAAAQVSLSDYVGSESCVGCHEDEASDWRVSHHAWAWNAPGPDRVLGDFDGTEFEHNGVLTRFLRDPDGDYVETEAQDGTRGTFRVEGTIGVEPLQQYILSPAPGRQQVLDIAWDTEANRWYHVFPDQEIGVNDGLHWAGPYKSWEARCAQCHATGYTRNYDSEKRVYAPELAETGVGCETCHGPGGRHVELAEQYENTGAWETGYGLAVDPGESAEAEIQECAGCHSRREAFTDGSPPPGVPYADHYGLSLLREGLYHADGTIQDEVYVYGSFLQSKMYARGVRCSDCHNPHSGELKAEGNGVCSQCHSLAGNPDFPSLPLAEYDDPSHHFHEPGSEGAQCASCHMPERVYMGVDGRRDHGFRVPRPDFSVETGAPNTCIDCHADRDNSWAAAEIASRFPESKNRGSHFSTTFARARLSPQGNVDDLISIAKDRNNAGIVRATALELMTPENTPEVAARVRPFMWDSDVNVRVAATMLQQIVPGPQRFEAVKPALQDPLRAVRIAAARALTGLAPQSAPPDILPLLEQPLTEWRSALAANLDFPETHMQVGGIGLASRSMGLSMQAWREAVELDPQLVDAWVLMIRVLVSGGNVAQAKEVVREALTVNPDNEMLLSMRTELATMK